MSGYTFEKHTQFCTLHFTSELAEMTWKDQEAATTRATELVHESGMDSVLIDLSEMSTLPSGLVASLIRIWQGLDESHRNFVVVASNRSVRNELQQAGLTSIWTLVDNSDRAYTTPGVNNATDVEISAVKNHYSTTQLFEFTEQRRYCIIQFSSRLASTDWSVVEQETTAVIAQLSASERTGVMVDLSNMDYINSGLVASLVRIWKATRAKNGQFSVVSPNSMVVDVLKTAGLWKMWSVVDTAEDAVYDLGVSTAARIEQRERRVLTVVAVPCAVVAILATVLMLLKRTEVMGVNAQLTALLFAAAAIATGGISVMKDEGSRRRLSAASVIAAMLVLSTLWFEKNPITFGQPFPERNLDRDSDNEPAVTDAAAEQPTAPNIENNDGINPEPE